MYNHHASSLRRLGVNGVEGAERARLELIIAARTSATVIYRERERERERTNKINTKKTHANQTNTYG